MHDALVAAHVGAQREDRVEDAAVAVQTEQITQHPLAQHGRELRAVRQGQQQAAVQGVTRQ